MGWFQYAKRQFYIENRTLLVFAASFGESILVLYESVICNKLLKLIYVYAILQQTLS